MAENGAERDAEIEEIIEKKVEERMEEKKQEIREEIKQELNQESRNHNSSDDQISRRSFLKKLGAGAVGLGALSLAPAASKLTISDTGITQNGEDLYLGIGGSSSMTGNLDMGEYQITGLADPTSDGHAVSRGWAQNQLASQNHGNSAHSKNYTTLSEVNNNANVPNADYASSAGDADTVDGYHSSDLMGGLRRIAASNHDYGGNVSASHTFEVGASGVTRIGIQTYKGSISSGWDSVSLSSSSITRNGTEIASGKGVHEIEYSGGDEIIASGSVGSWNDAYEYGVAIFYLI